MAYDEDLAGRVRELVSGHGPVEEKKMFGGLAFMLDGSMAVCVSGQGGLLLDVGEDEMAGLLGDHVAPMVMGGRESRSWVQVAPEGVGTDEQLDDWVIRGIEAARTRK